MENKSKHSVFLCFPSWSSKNIVKLAFSIFAKTCWDPAPHQNPTEFDATLSDQRSIVDLNVFFGKFHFVEYSWTTSQNTAKKNTWGNGGSFPPYGHPKTPSWRRVLRTTCSVYDYLGHSLMRTYRERGASHSPSHLFLMFTFDFGTPAKGTFLWPW